MFGKVYLIGGILLIALYSVVALTGREFGDSQRQVIPADVRQNPGGYRSFHFWHSGYRGGK
ncbi:MAG: hypothetical protein L0229_28070 [Blastocatellia bacterium]|nr:hypothetical protein [Blastocatellia bacterium]